MGTITSSGECAEIALHICEFYQHFLWAQGASAAASRNWLASVELLLLKAPSTGQDKQLWLTLLPVLSAVLAVSNISEVIQVRHTCTHFQFLSEHLSLSPISYRLVLHMVSL